VILIGLGGNLESPRTGPPVQTLEVALDELATRGVEVMARSRWWISPPDPPSDQPWFTNGVASISTDLVPEELLAVLLAVEVFLGRTRCARNAPRTVDLDLLAYRNLMQDSAKGAPVLPHPRMHLRSFVLLPMAEVAPGWRHPVLGQTVEELAASLPPKPQARPIWGG